MLIETSPPPQSGRAHSTISTTASDVSDYLEEGSAPWLSHLVINGIDLSINISAGKVDLSSDNDDPDHLAFARWECTAATDKLVKPRHPVTNQLDADTIRLDDRSVQRQVDLPGFIDICRPTVLRSNAVYREVTHDGQIFDNDSRDQPRFLVMLEPIRLGTLSGLMVEATPPGWRSGTMIDQSIPAACRLLVPSNAIHDHLLIREIDQSLLTPSSEFLIPLGRLPIPGETPFTGGCNE